MAGEWIVCGSHFSWKTEICSPVVSLDSYGYFLTVKKYLAENFYFS